MNQWRAVVLAVTVCLLQAACSNLPTQGPGAITGAAAPAAKVLKPNLDWVGLYDTPETRVREGIVYTLYPSAGKTAELDRGDKPIPLGENLGDVAGRYPFLVLQGDQVYVLWWKKTKPSGEKFLYFSASDDGGRSFRPAQVINRDAGALSPASFASDGDGHLGAIYMDERDKQYKIFFNYSLDDGHTWQARDARLDAVGTHILKDGSKVGRPGAIEPKLAYNGSHLIATWKEYVTALPGGKSELRLVSRTSDDWGKTWQPVIPIYMGEHFVTEDVVLVQDGYFYHFGHANTVGVLAHRTVDGKTWESLGVLPGSEKSVNSQLSVATTTGAINLVYTAKPDKTPNEIDFGRLDTATGKWHGPAQRIDRKGESITQAVNPTIAALPDDRLLIAWQDYSSIRPGIYVTTSADGGKTWASAPSHLTDPVHAAVNPQLVVDGDSVSLFYLRSMSDDLRKAEYVERKLAFASDGTVVMPPEHASISEAQRAELLHKRADEFWKLREQGKFADTYDYYDPYFRAKVSKQQFAGRQANVIFKRHDIGKVEIHGNVGYAPTLYTFEVPEQIVAGEKFSVPPTDDYIKSEWVWMDGNWYFVFQTAQKQRFLRY